MGWDGIHVPPYKSRKTWPAPARKKAPWAVGCRGAARGRVTAPAGSSGRCFPAKIRSCWEGVSTVYVTTAPKVVVPQISDSLRQSQPGKPRTAMSVTVTGGGRGGLRCQASRARL